ncbi:conserved hypothetical protein [Lodderomyces elongisporus NRRL YB-4239]|uniref:D-isomer specific 2-hydroxyacid dehydrogenase NAD-binding domain-containing protein n=1 Tax=Lodderomyces elongisporus (strain ATCC 11503 / CBS 2605 / JCM 1781 / NBRC 1676 / NRRL YB-4239) TaxID=379508 RepID=A5E7S9_LODEL|nr:conserved hypothetical protein [Lodderomyces elongisporus NRRL YB-4239]
MTKSKVLFIGDLNKNLPEYVQFKDKYECIHYTLTTKEQFEKDLSTKFLDISAIYAAWLGFVPIGGFRTVIDTAPTSLKVISFCSVGYDHADAEVMQARNIAMTNVPSDGAAEPVADLVTYYTISAFRQFHLYNKQTTLNTLDIRYQLAHGQLENSSGTVKAGSGKGYHFGETMCQRPNLSPRGHVVAIVGFGQIGRLIGRRLNELGMKIKYVKRSKLSKKEEESLGYTAEYFPTIVETQPDLIVIACPATPETYHIINDNLISSINKPFRIINIGRGTVIDESALLKGLQNGKVLFAGLDVFEEEPKINPEFFSREDVMITPHVGASTEENFDYTATQALKNIDDILSGGNGISRVN